jgi:membrane protease YdiL (CAAX protease family)
MNNAVFGILLAAGCAGILISFARARSRAVFHQDGFTDPPRRVAAIALLATVLLLTVAIPFAGGLAGGQRETRSLTLVSLFAVHAILVVFLFLYWALSRHEPVLDFLKLRSARPAKDLASGFFIGITGWLVTILIMTSILGLWYLVNRHALQQVMPREANKTIVWIVSQPLAVRIAIVLSAMVVEELFFRSFLQTRVGPLAATLMFTAAHGVYGQPLGLIGIFAISAVLSAAYALYGNVLPCIVAHGVFDAIQMFVLIPFSLRQLGGGA